MSDDTNEKGRKPDYYVQRAQVGRNGKERITDVGAVWNGKKDYKTGETIFGNLILQPRAEREAAQELLPANSTGDRAGFNPDDYKDDLGVIEFADEEIELLKIIWDIMGRFVDLGWDMDAVPFFLPQVFGTTRTSTPCLPPSPASGDTERGIEKGTHDE